MTTVVDGRLFVDNGGEEDDEDCYVKLLVSLPFAGERNEYIVQASLVDALFEDPSVLPILDVEADPPVRWRVLDLAKTNPLAWSPCEADEEYDLQEEEKLYCVGSGKRVRRKTKHKSYTTVGRYRNQSDATDEYLPRRWMWVGDSKGRRGTDEQKFVTRCDAREAYEVERDAQCVVAQFSCCELGTELNFVLRQFLDAWTSRSREEEEDAPMQIVLYRFAPWLVALSEQAKAAGCRGVLRALSPKM